jgi:predicted O-linked N-acetylglucosamine transferase (SPINDLY family)
MRRRLESAFERFIDVRGFGDDEIAQLLRDREIDVAVDLMGYTGECRSGIFARRPAPLQVNYLGFCGTMAAPYIDYIVADPTVIPEEQHGHYTESIAYLPHCYLPCDRTRMVSQSVPARAEAGLPQTGLVFASFNNAYKFNPSMFDIWMRLLGDIANSALWLPQNNASARRNLAREAEARGVAPSRLIFAPPIPDAAAHLARLSLADLFLDTLPYNAHSTAIDALWAGVPVLTLMGNSFGGRVAASALKAVGLAELIAKTPADYEAMARKFAQSPAALAEMRAKLARNRLAAPLFDTARFTRDLETAFASMRERHQRGERPASFAVASAD